MCGSLVSTASQVTVPSAEAVGDVGVGVGAVQERTGSAGQVV